MAKKAKYREIKVCGKCLGEYTEEETIEQKITKSSSEVVSPCCKEPGFWKVLVEEKTGTRYLQEHLIAEHIKRGGKK